MFRRVIESIRTTVAQLKTRNVAQKDRGEMVIVERQRGENQWNDVLIGCCDCGLMHRFDFYRAPNGDLVMRAKRDLRATEAMRRAKDFPFQPDSRKLITFRERLRADLSRRVPHHAS